MDYEKLLQKGRKELPESVFKAERFETPKVMGHIQGNRTVLSNFFQIAQTLRRDPKHILKYILKELATPGDVKGNLVILARKVSASLINNKIEQYTRLFVLCSECGKPDTQLTKEGNVTFLKCLACGGKNPVRAKI